MPKLVERYKDDLILCSACKRYLPRDNFSESGLRRGKFDCKICYRQYQNEWNHKHGVKSWEERKKEREETRQKEFLSDPYQEINKTIQRLIKERGTYQDRGENVCGFCDRPYYVTFNGKRYCQKDFLIECLAMGKPLSRNLHCEESVRKLGILSDLEELGVNID
jgi:hypothetical protein